MKVLILLAGLAVGQSLAQDCWWTGCQPNDWAEKGCAQYDREEKSRKSCRDGNGKDGFKYYCCEKRGGGGGGGDSGDVNYDQFSRAVTSNGYPTPSQTQFNLFKKNAGRHGKISSKQELAMALAQMLHESDGLVAKREYACRETQCPNSYRNPACDAKGQYYYGRGYIQLTGCENYKRASQGLFRDNRLVNDPDRVAREETLAWESAFWYWGEFVHNARGVQQGKFGATTKAINGPMECSSSGHPTPPKRFKIYGRVRSAFGLQGAGDSSGCA